MSTLSSPPEIPTDLVFVYTVPHGVIDVNGHEVFPLS